MKILAVIFISLAVLAPVRAASPFGNTGGGAAPAKTIQFLQVPWGAAPADVKRLLIKPDGPKVAEETPEHLVLTGGTYESCPVDRWEFDFTSGKFSKVVVRITFSDDKNAQGEWLNNERFNAFDRQFGQKYGERQVENDDRHFARVWSCLSADGINEALILQYAWVDRHFDLTYALVPNAPNSTAPATVTVSAPAPAPTAAPAPAGASALVKSHRDSLVFVTGADGAGSGFVATLGGANFLFTNAHVAAGIKSAGFKSLDGTRVTGGAPSIAVGHDIFRLQLGNDRTPFEIMQAVDQNVTIDDEVVVLGNAEGAGVINPIKGKVVGIGPQLVEVDAPFQPGNSGSPIIHLKTGKVIGVATYLTVKKYDATTKEILKTPVIRRFGYRIDSVKSWQPVNWPTFRAQADAMEKIEGFTNDLANFLVDFGRDGIVDTDAHTNPAIKNRIDQWQEQRRKPLSPADALQANLNFLSFLKVACHSDILAAQQRMTYDYFRRELATEQQERTEIADVFDKIIKDLGRPR